MSGATGTNGASAANGSGGNNNNTSSGGGTFTTPVKSKPRTRSKMGGLDGAGTGSVPPVQTMVPSGGSSVATSTTPPPKADVPPGDGVCLQDIPFKGDDVKPLIKPDKVQGNAHWDGKAGTGDRLALARRCLRFWKSLAHVAIDSRWSEAMTWLYVKNHGFTGPSMTDECRNMADFKGWLEEHYLEEVTVAALVSPMYCVEQGRTTITAYAQAGEDTWKEVCDLAPTQEEVSVQVWVSRINPEWARLNQLVYDYLGGCSTWKEVRAVVARWKTTLNDLHPPRPAQVPPPPTAAVPAVGAKKGGAKERRLGPGCWICGSMEHMKRECPDRPVRPITEPQSQGKETGRSE